MDIFFIFLFGLATGSFLNVCISRIPRGESIIFPPSCCDHCGVRLRPIDLVPVASFLLLRRKCRYCGCRLSWRYPGIELLTGLIFVLVYGHFGFGLKLAPFLIFAALLVLISFVDLDHYRIPDRFILLGLGVGMAFQILMPFMKMVHSLIGLAVGGGILFLIALVSRGGMGGGDIKLGALIGFFLGWRLMLLTLFLAALLAALSGIVLIIQGKKTRKDPIPFGPFLSLGALISLLWGDLLILWYVQYFIS